MIEVEKHYTEAEVAKLLGVAKRTVRNYIRLGESTRGKEGIYPTVKISYKIMRVPARAVNRFLKAHTVTSETVEAGI